LNSFSQRLFSDQFTYGNTAGSIISLSNGVWLENTNASATNIVQYDNSSSLIFPNAGSLGGKLTLQNNGQDVTAGFPLTSTGTVYAAMLVNFSAVQSGDYFFHFMPSQTQNTFTSRLFVKTGSAANTMNFGLMKNSGGTTPYSTTNYLLNTTYCVVVKYQFNSSSTTDDVSTLYVFDATNGIPSIEPTTNELQVSTNTDATAGVGAFGIRQGTSSAAATGSLDNIVISTEWTNLLSVLPVTLKSLKASLINNAIDLNWATSNETNFDYFGVEKSFDAKNFSPIAKVASNKTTNGSNYAFTDFGKTLAQQYYRLKMVDNDGSFKYSQVVAVNGKASTSLEVFPNPVVNTVIMSHPKAAAGATIRIVSVDGRSVSVTPVQTGATQTSIDVTRFVKSNYIASFEDKNEKSTVRFTKQ